MNKPITIWKRFYKPSTLKHNHIEDGHTENIVPTPMNDYQKKCWDGADDWFAELAYLDENNKVCYES